MTRLTRLWIVTAAVWWLATYYAFYTGVYLSWLWGCRLNPDSVAGCIVSYIPWLAPYHMGQEYLHLWRFDILAAPFYCVLLFLAGRWALRGKARA